METSRDDARKSYRERSSRRSRDSFSADQYNAGQATYITPDYYQYAGSIPAVEHSYYNSAPEQHSSFNDSDQEDPAEQLIDGHQSDLWEHHSRKPVPVPQYAGYSTSSGLHRSQAQQYQRQTALAPADGAGYFPDTTTLDQWPARVPGPENQASQFVCIQEYPPNGPVTERIPATSSTLASEKTHRRTPRSDKRDEKTATNSSLLPSKGQSGILAVAVTTTSGLGYVAGSFFAARKLYNALS